LRSRLAADIAALTAKAEAVDVEDFDPQALLVEIARRETLQAKLDAACVRLEAQARAEAEAALDAARTRRPDLILTDAMRPRLDGFGLLQAVRADGALRDVPIVLLSARAGEEAKIEGLEAGADDYLLKPFSARELIARVDANLQLARLRHETGVSERRYREAQMELAHVNRIATVGQLAASIAHEVKQPIAATVASAQAALLWLGRRPPELEEVRRSLAHIAETGYRAGDIVDRLRALVKKAPSRNERQDINARIREVIELTRGEAGKNGVSVQTELVDGLPLIDGDRVQLQQVILNLIMNAIEAMGGVSDGTRELLISTRKAEPDGVLVAVRDSGPELAPATLEHVFDAFYTTKPSGLGLGLSICRSIIEAHGGRLWATANVPHGATFQFTLPVNADTAS
jgi:C4-dicarboxylate-specific signal transduction histidine kinase